MTASSSRLRITCRRVAPIALSSAISRERWVTIIVNVFQMMKEPTNSATPAKIMNRIPTNLRSSLTASEFSLATVAPVTASVPSGTTAARLAASSFWLTPSSALTLMVSNEPGLAQQLLRGGGLEVRRRGAAEVLLATEADGADDGELLGRTLEQHLDRRAELDVVLLGAGGVDGDLVGAVRRFTRQQVHVAAELLVGGHAVAHVRGATLAEDGLAVVVGEQGVAADGALGGADAVDVRDVGEDRRGDRGRGWCRSRRTRCRGPRCGRPHRCRRRPCRRAGEREPHGVGQDRVFRRGTRRRVRSTPW